MDGDLFGLYELEQDTSYVPMALHFGKNASKGVHCWASQSTLEAAQEILDQEYGPLEWTEPIDEFKKNSLGKVVWKHRWNLVVVFGEPTGTVLKTAFFTPPPRARTG